MENNKCKECIFYKMYMQSDFLVNGEVLNCCIVYKEGIPKEIWEEKKDCKEYLKDIEQTEAIKE